MAALHVSPELASRIQAEAEQTHQSVEELLAGWMGESNNRPPNKGLSNLSDAEEDDEELVFPEAFAELLELSKDWEWKPEDPLLSQHTSEAMRRGLNEQYAKRLEEEK